MAASNTDYSAVRSFLTDEGDWSDYGIDDESPVPDTDADNEVEVPEIHMTLTEAERQQLEASVNPLSDDSNHGVTLFVNALRTVESFLHL